MAQETLLATQQAAWAAQSAAEAAWWGLLINGLAAAGAVGALWFAAIEWTRAARFGRLRAATEIARILETVGPIRSYFSEGKTIDTSDALYLMEGRVLDECIAAIPHLTMDHVPSTEAVRRLDDLKAALPSLKMLLQLPFLAPKMLERDVRSIVDAIDYLTLLRQVLLTNSASARRQIKLRF